MIIVYPLHLFALTGGLRHFSLTVETKRFRGVCDAIALNHSKSGMAYAIARIKKLKRSNLAGSEAHTARQRETPNADSDKQNIRFIGTNNPTLSLDQLVMEKIGEQKRKIRPDAVYCTEILLTASPEYFLPLLHISEPTRLRQSSYDVFSWKKKNKNSTTVINLQFMLLEL